MMGWVVRILVTLIGSTLRYRVEDPNGLLRDTVRRPLIFAFWHNRIFLMPHLFGKYWKSRKRARAAVLVSASKDGERLTQVLNRFNVVSVRGSSSRRGSRALRELMRLMEDGFDVGITPDGPRGPKYQAHDGVIQLASLTQAPIIPVSYVLSRKITFNSWDAFMVPLPFARCIARAGAPITVPRDIDGQQFENKRLELETVLRALSGEENSK